MEPERPIEKALRAAAKQRREQAGPEFEMHPATRRLLQNEVARRYPPGKGRLSSFGWLLRARPRLAWGLAGVTLLVLAGTAWLILATHDRSETLMAKNESVRKRAEELSAAPQPVLVQAASAEQKSAAAAMPATTAARRELNEMPDKPKAETPALQQRSMVAEAPALADSAGTSRLNLNGPAPAAAPRFDALPPGAGTPVADGKGLGQITGPELPAAMVTKSAGSEKKALVAGVTSFAAADNLIKSQPLIQHFVHADMAALAKDSQRDQDQAPTPILASFTVEQSGHGLRVIDTDGSVYTGYLNSATGSADGGIVLNRVRALAPATSSNARSTLTTGQLAPGRQPQATYFFRVAGTNRTLGQQVVFSGNLFGLNNTSSALPTLQSHASEDSAHAGPAQPDAWTVFVQQISGQAVIEQSRTNAIDAVLSK
jgi:hypothetical protein